MYFTCHVLTQAVTHHRQFAVGVVVEVSGD